MYSIHGITEENLESSNRPSDTPWTDEDNARYVSGRIGTIKLTHKRDKRRQGIQKHYIADPYTCFTFWVDTAKGEVEITASRLRGNWSRYIPDPVLMSVEAARTEWARLIDSGFTKW